MPLEQGAQRQRRHLHRPAPADAAELAPLAIQKLRPVHPMTFTPSTDREAARSPCRLEISGPCAGCDFRHSTGHYSRCAGQTRYGG